MVAARRPPGTLWPPLIGQTPAFLADPLRFLQRGAQRHGSVFKANIVGRPTVFMLGPECNEFVLKTHADRFSWREGYGDVAHRLFGEALIMLDDDAYVAIRRALIPAFDRVRLARQLPTIDAIVRAEIERALARRQLLLYRTFKRMALRVALRCFTGVDVVEEGPRAGDAVIDDWVALFDRFSAGLFTPFAWRLPGMAFAGAWSARTELRARLRELVVAQSRHEEGHVCAALSVAEDPGGRRLTVDEVVEHLVLLLFAGHDTTASLATWLAYEFVRRPELAQRAREECFDAMGVGCEPTMDQIARLRFLGACIHEAERLYPPAPTGFRGTRGRLYHAGYEIPDGWIVAYSPLFTHYMPEIYPRPRSFEPARFLGPQMRPTHSLIGFGGGVRKCVGEAFARLELKILTARWLQAVEARLVEDRPPAFAYMPALHPRGGLPVELARRVASPASRRGPCVRAPRRPSKNP